MKEINLGIIGGGQLGSMLCMAAKKLDIHTIVWSDDPVSPAKEFSDEFIFSNYSDNEKINYFTKKVDKITFEFENIPFDCSSSLNLIAVHPSLIEFARSALKTNDVRLYQAQAWAKFTGEADFDQAFHCDFGNHTLTVPSQDECFNSITFIIYFTDATEEHGPTHYVNRTDSNGFEGMKRFLKNREDVDHQRELRKSERSAAGPAGTLLAYGIDIFHRGTNLTEPGGYRYAMTSCFKKAGNDSIGYTSWPWHFTKPWQNIFEHATPDQLSCFGVPMPGDPFWTEETLSLAQLRYPKWNMSEYR